MSLLEMADVSSISSLSTARKVTGTFNAPANEEADDDTRKFRQIAHMKRVTCERDIVAHARRKAVRKFVVANSGCGLMLVRQEFPDERRKTLVSDLRWLRNQKLIAYLPGKGGGTYWEARK